MKKLRIAILFTLIATLFCISSAYANNISTNDITVCINDDGSANVTQVWNGTFESGTENYIPINNSGDIDVLNLSVSDENGQYTYIDNWDIDKGFDEKRGKCGILNTDNGWELCFGISQYGNNKYTIEYKINGLVGSYSDYDGFNFMFVNRDMNTTPTDAKIHILLNNGTALNEKNAAIWAFGYHGQIEFQNGQVTAYTQQSLQKSHSMIVMLQLNKGIISPARSVNSSFADVKDIAFENSSYDNPDASDSDWITTLVKIGFLIVAAIVLLIIIFLIKRKININKFYKQANYFRDVPNHKNLSLSYYLAKTYDVISSENEIIGASILKMINDKNIEPYSEEKAGLFGKVKTSTSLKLNLVPSDEQLSKLYSIMQGAAGSDMILQEKELEKYSEKHSELLRSFIENSEKIGKSSFVVLNGFSNGAGNCIKDLSDTGKKELAEIMGLKKYLLDFSLIAEREIKEAAVWKDYLVYATLFGIADKVMEQFKKIYPNNLTEIKEYDRNVLVAYSYHHSMYRAMQRAEQAKRSSGAGGASSFGGGGGFSGGGSGGGSR